MWWQLQYFTLKFKYLFICQYSHIHLYFNDICYMHKHKKIQKIYFVSPSSSFFISHHLLPRSSSILPFIHGSMAHALKASSLKFDLTRERLQQYKAKKRRNLCSSCSSSSRKTARLMWSPPQLGLIPTEASCQEQIISLEQSTREAVLAWTKDLPTSGRV